MTIHDLFERLDRCAPGDAASLTRACKGLAPSASVLDAGCGTGADLPALAALVPDGQVTAVDLAAPFIAAVRARFPKVRAVVADMVDPPDGPYDLIWSGGAIYGPGITTALQAWRDKLHPGGRVVFTELVLRSGPVAPEVAAFFAAEGVPLRDPGRLKAEVEAAGWHFLGGDWLPDSAWEAYYLPLEARLDGLDHKPELADLVAGLRAEIALWRRHGKGFGYYLAVTEPK